ncbi:hypothetical protein D1C45_08240 [Salmonella enterica]|uniref:Uncharacterized protein n=1 Tax=Salmonella diarizonae TaxID=59204 RepID=A0A2I5HE02_SALDZ|nr:hypothetical protein CNQ75_04095 [Salmonella enterica subsp. diarizonae]EBI3719848.1 hypothetical protein [Salmonella enterica]
MHEYFNCLNYFTLRLLSERANTSALSHNVMAIIEAKTGIYFTVRTRFAALFTASLRKVARNNPYFRGNGSGKPKNTA